MILKWQTAHIATGVLEQQSLHNIHISLSYFHNNIRLILSHVRRIQKLQDATFLLLVSGTYNICFDWLAQASFFLGVVETSCRIPI